MRKPGLPPAPQDGEPRAKFDRDVKQSLEILMGRRGDRVAQIPNPDTVTSPEIARKINEILELLQG